MSGIKLSLPPFKPDRSKNMSGCVLQQLLEIWHSYSNFIPLKEDLVYNEELILPKSATEIICNIYIVTANTRLVVLETDITKKTWVSTNSHHQVDLGIIASIRIRGAIFNHRGTNY